MVKTQINIIFITLIISCFIKNLEPDYFSIMNQILRYLAGSQDKSVMFGRKSKFCLVWYLDSNWARNHADKKSISRFVFTLNREFINYSSKKQAVIVLFSIKTEYLALSLAVQEVI